MAFRYLDRTGDTGTYDSTPTPKEVDLAGTGVDGLRTFAEAITDTDFASLDETAVTIVDSSGNWATYIATITSGTPDVLDLDTLIASEGTIADEAAVTVYAVITQNELKRNLFKNNYAITTTDFDAVIGKHDFVDLSGLTADRNWVLQSGNDGDICAITVTDAATATSELIIKGDTGIVVALGGTDYTAAEATRLFLKGETMVFQCDSDGVWYPIEDGRILAFASLSLSSNLTTNSAGVWTRVPFDTIDKNIGITITTGTSCQLKVRRAGVYQIKFGLYTDGSVGVRKYTAIKTSNPGGLNLGWEKRITGTLAKDILGSSCIVDSANGDIFYPVMVSEEANKGASSSLSTSYILRETGP